MNEHNSPRTMTIPGNWWKPWILKILFESKGVLEFRFFRFFRPKNIPTFWYFGCTLKKLNPRILSSSSYWATKSQLDISDFCMYYYVKTAVMIKKIFFKMFWFRICRESSQNRRIFGDLSIVDSCVTKNFYIIICNLSGRN